ncbi:hypothetical protein WNY51_14185 [Pseudocolwellia sp. AS88]|uniref:hypothetical protein n=1 Tax=Pseudocolwellia sp. AS88 TaxID=3063958 RepID=UPI0026EC08F1|nr:hypothetical protein [Pseudocolwellia sp. AS88]MDO7086617.1 hypothetical protein [Pseudocolwellia sp. AS88]
MRVFLLSCFIFIATGCSTTYSNKDITGSTFPSVLGESLEQEQVNLPEDFKGKLTLLLVGYKQDSQFDIDRWLIGLDMTETLVDVYEIPTIQGLFPRMFSTMINNGMRKGIPKELWKGVVTVYEDGERVQEYTGNETPNNTRVILLDKSGKVIYFYDRGFSVAALNELRSFLDSNN